MDDRVFSFEVTCKNSEVEPIIMAIEAASEQCLSIAKDFVKEVESNTSTKVHLTNKIGYRVNPMAIISFKSDFSETFGPWFDKFIKKHKIK